MAEIVSMPKLGFDMAEGTLVRWLKNEGDPISKGDILAEIETDKATVEVESIFSGVVRKLFVEQGTVVSVNASIALIGSGDEDISQWLAMDFPVEMKASGQIRTSQGIQVRNDPKVQDEITNEPARQQERKKISPLARRLAKEQGIPLDTLQGSGPGGRIVRRDLDGLKKGVIDQKTALEAGEKKVAISKLRQVIGRRLVDSKQKIPHFYVTRNYDVGRLKDIRAQYNKILSEDEKISINDFVVKATAMALREYPNLNASLDGEFVIQHNHVNIGIAVAVDGGLMTVVCRDVDLKSLRQISQETKLLATRARSGKVKPEDIEGSTFSISNLGMYDIYEFIAIINPPEAAILALGGATLEAVVENGVVQPGWRMRATISVDHRISDGAEAARFLQTLGKFLEEPVRLLVD